MLKIGQLAKQAGVSVETIRYYEQRKLLETPSRSASGYRVYGEAAQQRLGFIQRAKRLGFSLEEIRELLELQLSPEQGSDSVKEVVDEKITLIDRKLEELGQLRRALAELSSRCDGTGTRAQCPILEFLSAQESS